MRVLSTERAVRMAKISGQRRAWKNGLVEQAKELRGQGYRYDKISILMGISHTTAIRLSRGYR